MTVGLFGAAASLTPLGAPAAASGSVASGSASAGPSAASALQYATVFKRGEGGYHTFRVPAVVQAADGTLLAFAEGRVTNAGDDGDIDLVLKRSADRGATWGPLRVVVDDGANKVGNPVPVLDRRTGRIVLNATRTGGGVTSEDIRCGRASTTQTRRSFVLHSDDHGASWSRPREITQTVRPDTWRHFVGGPGHAIQLAHGPHAGRLVVPGNHSIAPPPGSGIDCRDNRLLGAHTLYSDDGGHTWHLGGVDTPLTGRVNPNESIAVELTDGTVYFNARDQHGISSATRAATSSSDGGASFDAPYRPVGDLVAPVVQGSALALSRSADRHERLVFSAPGRASARAALTLRTSMNGGASWQRGLVVHDGPAGYSDLVEVGRRADNRALGVLYENGDTTPADPLPAYHQRITFAHVPVAALATR